MKKMKNEETSRRIREILSLRNLSQQELADKSGVAKASISQYVNGTHVPGNKKAGQMAEVLKCDPLWLMGFDVPMEKELHLTATLTPITKEDFIATLLSKMTDEDKDDLISYMEYRISKHKPS